MKKSLIWLFVIVVIIAITASFMLSGCKEEAASVEETAEETVEEEAPEEEAVEKEPVNLVFWDFGNYGEAALQKGLPQEEWYIFKAIERFEAKNPGIDIELTYQPAGKSTEMLTAAGMSKQGPDIVSLWGGAYIEAIKDTLLDLKDYFTQEEINAVVGWENSEFDGHYYGAPIMSDSTGIFYNKAIFKEAGIDPETEYDGTYNGLVEICEKLKNAGIIPLVTGAADGWGPSFFEGSLVASQVAPGTLDKLLAEIMSGEKDFATSPEFVAAFQAQQDLYTKGYYNEDAHTITWSEANTLFASGGGAMVPNGMSGVLLAYVSALGDDLGLLPMPSMEADSPWFGVTIGAVGTNGLCATNYGEHPVESTDFIKFIRSYEEEREHVKDTGGLPSVKGDYGDIDVGHPFISFINIDNVATYMDNSMPHHVSDTWWKFEPLMLSGQMSVLEFMETMDSARDEVLAENE